MKDTFIFLLLLVWMISAGASQERGEAEKAKPFPSAGLPAAPDQKEEEKPKSQKVRGIPLEPSKKGKARTSDGRLRPVEPKADTISEKAPAPQKRQRRIIITDTRQRKIELTDFHLGSSGVWEYDGLRIRKPEDVLPSKKKKQEPVGKARSRSLQKSLQERLARKRVNRPEPDPRPSAITNDTVVRWNTIKEADIFRDKKDKKLYARVITLDNKLIKGPVNLPSDYLIGTLPNGKDFVLRIRNVSHISFTIDEPELARKTAASDTKPRVGKVQRGDTAPKKMQSKANSGG